MYQVGHKQKTKNGALNRIRTCNLPLWNLAILGGYGGLLNFEGISWQWLQEEQTLIHAKRDDFNIVNRGVIKAHEFFVPGLALFQIDSI